MALRLWAAWAVLVLAGCSVPSLEELRNERSADVEVSFNFRAGCIVVTTEDAANPASPQHYQVEVFSSDPAARSVTTTVARKQDWSETLLITASAREVSCEGPMVASQVARVTLDRKDRKRVALTLEAVDADNDGYVPAASGGTDCDDSNAEVSQRSFFEDGDGDGFGGGTVVQGCTAPSARHVARGGDCDDTRSGVRPELAEVCDGLDNDCQNGADDGLPQTAYFMDGDRDGWGAGAAVTACTAPAGHVEQAGDCDDADAQLRPGLAEVCDGKDNDCQNGVDDGLALTTYYRDSDADTYGATADSRRDCRASAGYVTRAGDCDDADAQRRPGLPETCDGKDNNCQGGVDEFLQTNTYYRDADTDTYGSTSDTRWDCRAPSGYVTQSGDCDDGNPSVRPGATELCNNIDDNCVSGADESFMTGPGAKGTACSTPCPGGTYICNPSGSATVCDAPQPRNQYPDVDGDGAGDAAATAQSACPGTPSWVENQRDCDDRDRHNFRDNAEVCDDRDNNCVNGADEGNICGGMGWGQLTDTAVTGNRTWNTVAVNQGSPDGYPVWIAGSGGALARRTSALTAFTSFAGTCGSSNWRAAWVRPSNGAVYLAGDGGRVVEFSGGGPCPVGFSLTGGSQATGIVGFESGTPPNTTVLLYVVDVSGRLHSWSPPSAPQVVDDNTVIYRDVHGFSSGRLFLAGQDSFGSQFPVIDSYTGGSDTSRENITFDNLGTSVRAVWMGASNFAYAVGDNSIVKRWNGTSWETVLLPEGVNFTSVCAPDPSSGYMTDSAGVIHRYTGSGWVRHYTAVGPLHDIALVSPTNVWAVGPGGRVIHFPAEP